MEEEEETLEGRVEIKLNRSRSRTRDSGDLLRKGKRIPLFVVVGDALLVVRFEFSHRDSDSDPLMLDDLGGKTGLARDEVKRKGS